MNTNNAGRVEIIQPQKSTKDKIQLWSLGVMGVGALLGVYGIAFQDMKIMLFGIFIAVGGYAARTYTSKEVK